MAAQRIYKRSILTGCIVLYLELIIYFNNFLYELHFKYVLAYVAKSNRL